MGASLITTYHHDASQARRLELQQVIRTNTTSGLFERVHVLATPWELGQLAEELLAQFGTGSLARVYPHPLHDATRPTFAQLFDLATMANAEPVVIANGDIAFTDTLGLCWSFRDPGRIAFAITRHDRGVDGRWTLRPNAEGSQDAWAFRPFQVRPLREAAFPIGAPGCDNRLAAILMAKGYRVINPAKTVAIHHHHATRSPNTLPAIVGSYHHPKPVAI